MPTGKTYAKTATGAEEMRAHSLGLSVIARRLLILVDGQRTLEQLRPMLGANADAEGALAQLLQHELISVNGSDTAAEPAKSGFFSRLGARAEPAQSAPVDPALIGRIRTASMQLHDALGPSADSIVMRLESCTDNESLTTVLLRAAEAVRDMRGRAAAVKFRSALELPPLD
jgi:hypothetical protein